MVRCPLRGDGAWIVPFWTSRFMVRVLTPRSPAAVMFVIVVMVSIRGPGLRRLLQLTEGR